MLLQSNMTGGSIKCFAGSDIVTCRRGEMVGHFSRVNIDGGKLRVYLLAA